MKKALLLLAASFFFFSCSSDRMVKSPVDELVRTMDQEKNFTIVLYDMDIEGSIFETYKHKYKILTPKPTGEEVQVVKDNGDTLMVAKDTMMVSYTDWYEVDEKFFNLHSSDMGMEIAHKRDGVLKKEVAPAGYSQYVGNKNYGEWRTDSSGNSFWHFYGQYMFMRSMFNLATFPIYASMYNDYGRYRSMGRPYYGGVDTRTGNARYGTYSSTTAKMNPSFSNKMASNSSFSQKVSSKVSKSSSAAKAGSRSVTSSAAKTTRSSSRYGTSSSSSSRSRSSSGGGK
ncbi:hypothetical protein [Sediminitomix flava]|uniref:Lipoprotein n=1 Tax=Sediminitomix flava TaxID=379075 RepID=A0A315ZGQ8_SEDFL|nr:hypothetical protein [Sediminitomix flava]PWJ44532.1 hypothetical protein BC781_101903 [Sediminitomix flava]